MMNENLLKLLLDTFGSLIPESFYEFNYREEVVYPYMTFTYSQDTKLDVHSNRKNFYLDCDLFDDSGTNSMPLEKAYERLSDFIQLIDSSAMNDYYFIRFESIRSNPIPTGSDKIKRKNAQIYISVDERTKNYG